MTVDISRKSFDPRRHTAWTTTMQGRVATDAPVNENQSQRDRRVRALLTDLAGRCGYPEILPDSFKIGIAGGELTIAPGRYYVDGHLADNFGAGAPLFDTVLSEERGADPVAFSAQPFGTGGAGAPTTGLHIAYVDVWQRDVTFLEDLTILDPAISTDTFARRQTVWQVRTFGPVGAGTTCSTDPATIAGWDDLIAPSTARLSTRADPANAVTDPCLLPPGALYRGIDNRTYLVAIHAIDGAGVPQVKFSRTNGSVATAILARPQADVLEVAQVAKDDFLRFNPGDWVEITDEARLLAGQAGTMARVLTVDDAANTITLEDPLPASALVLVGASPDADQTVRPVLRRWDQAGEIRDETGAVVVDLDAPGATGLIPMPTDGTFVSLEDGVEAAMTLAAGAGAPKVNDNWSFIARYADSSVEELAEAPPQDYHHHNCRLAMVSAAGGVFTAVEEDCRNPLGGDCDCCCTVTVEVGDSIQTAIDSLPVETGGCVCLVAGVHQLDGALHLTTSNVLIVGESRGAIVERMGDGTVLRVEDASNIDIDMIDFRHVDGGDAEAMLEIIDCQSVNVWRCAFSANDSTTSTGIAVNGSEDVAIRDCSFAALAFGVVTVGPNGLLAVTDSVFELYSEKLVGQAAVVAQKSTAVLRITGNAISGVLNGIVINDDLTSETRHSLAAGSLVADNIVRLRYNEQEGVADGLRGIDSAADECTVRGNQITLQDHQSIGIFASGSGLVVVENQIELEEGQDGAVSGGIIIGATDDDAGHLTNAVLVAHNFVRDTMIGIVVGHASEVVVADNHLQAGPERQLFSLMLNDTVATTVRGNTIGRSAAALFANDCRLTSIIGNRFAPSGVGIALLQEFAGTIADNVIDQARTFGVALVQAAGRTEVRGNRLRGCGYGGDFAGGIVALLVLGEFAVCGNEIVDIGIGPDGKPNDAAVAGIVGALVLEALVSENLVTYTQIENRPDGLEDRALRLLGMWEFSNGPNEFTLGFPCTIVSNKFYGKGFSALVQLAQIPVNDSFNLRFERVFFSNNYCMHFGPFDNRGATVMLTGTAGTVMGNHVKGPRGKRSIDMGGMAGAVVGNVTSGDIVNDFNFPAPETNFNLRF
ncbi:MAG: right-handed parallel beta-helix repeat-containing protein [Geodermatophilaceae bacterium]|nr:right-handed parallel beta-helix repeat-containing protein [Geodermatophilaceae bacterium]